MMPFYSGGVRTWVEELEICVQSMGEAPRWAKKNYFSEKIDVKPLKDSR